jgi:Flp pilus assembly protein TadG
LKKRLFRRFKKNERGASLVEFALVFPILLLLVLGIIEFGWAFNGWIILTGAAREGARVAVLDKNNDADAISAVLTHTTTFNTSPSVTITRGQESVTVSVVGHLTPLVGFFKNSDFVIPADATMRREYLN